MTLVPRRQWVNGMLHKISLIDTKIEARVYKVCVGDISAVADSGTE